MSNVWILAVDMNCVSFSREASSETTRLDESALAKKEYLADATAGVDGNLIMAGAMLVNIIDDFETTAPPPGPALAT